MGGPCDCDGKSHSELDNFYRCRFQVNGEEWHSSEQYYQACKFPDNAALRERIRQSDEGMGSYKLGNSDLAKLRTDWEEVKVEMMYQANLQKFLQNPALLELLVKTKGPITARGGFWKTWNEIILERIREVLRGPSASDSDVLDSRMAMMCAYRKAAAANDQRLVEAVTQAASKRQVFSQISGKTIMVEGHDTEHHKWMGENSFDIDPLQPQANCQSHYVSSNGAHIYLGVKRGKSAWVIDECFAANEMSGQAFILVDGGSTLPAGKHVWQYFDDTIGRHVSRELVVTMS
eukprot:gnl/MRDRNA2_/MRDRNA2_88354_c0_seq1.p1 gnl/MRDRNA2_/MRDRNA2_88354_c0~~gnl/MRDRNA2_/MRDRNA2_88354_c0_seq1.p1  ORF type:complete len:290 (-),score=47.05 gnl/MRDRNA2_/MRDRNA2_88354_c0_seq1:196-1065(-)